jgi:hypothetical protein
MVCPTSTGRGDGEIRPSVTASKKSIAAVADAAAIVPVKSGTGVPSHVIPSPDVPKELRLQFVADRLICAASKAGMLDFRAERCAALVSLFRAPQRTNQPPRPTLSGVEADAALRRK